MSGNLKIHQPTTERDNSSPVRSHQSFDPQVEAICHHSGQYLTREEGYDPVWKNVFNRLLREQHDFPGLPILDRDFRQAAHAREHRHVVWSRIAFQSIALLLPIPVIVYLLYSLTNLLDYAPLLLYYPLIGLIGIVGLVSTVIFLYAAFRYIFRESIFHRTASGKPPRVLDYPMRGHFSIHVQEYIQVALDNFKKKRPNVTYSKGKLSAKLISVRKDWEDYTTHATTYDSLGVGGYVHGGVIALENVTHINFLDDVPEFDHRIVMRNASQRIDFTENDEQSPTIDVRTTYEILPSALFLSENDGLDHFPLEIVPMLSPNDSRTLALHVNWKGPDPLAECRMDSLILEDIPVELGSVVRVKYGRATQNPDQIIWRNRPFYKQSLYLEMTFEEPILECQDHLVGRFEFSSNSLLSNIKISPDRIWNSLGRPIKKEDCEISFETSIKGTIDLSLQRLSQEHEYIRIMEPIECQSPPNQELVRAITNVLLSEQFDLQRVMRTAPRLDPTGKIDSQLFYWDILGRRYIEELLEAVDVHLVITGSDSLISRSELGHGQKAYTHIDLRARCLHDPRNESTPHAVDALIGDDENIYSLRNKILAVLSDNSIQ